MIKNPRGAVAIAPILFSVILLNAGCGNSGGDVRSNATPPPSSSPPAGGGGPTFTAGVFAPSSQFEDRCAVVRTGVDSEGNAFPDRSGSTLEENFWLRSWTNETYLFNTEVVDRNPADFSNPRAYFSVLRTTQQTPSGRDKDVFHFSQLTEEFLRQRNSAPSAGYGASIIAFSTTVPRDFRIRFTEPNSPASEVVMGEAKLVRGTRILEVDGVDVVNATSSSDINMLNAGLFPASSGEAHTFQVQDPGGVPRNIQLVSTDLARKPVNRTRVINTATGKVGYILFNTFSPFASERDIAEAITAMSVEGISDLVLDLRYNGGGLLAVASQLSYMVAGDAQTNGKIFERFQFNAAAGNTNPVTGELNEPIPFLREGLGFSLAAATPLDTLDLPRVFILSTAGTCSASESVINSLRGVNVEVILIGNTTCGKPYGFFPEDNCGETYFTIQFQGVNDKGFGDYTDGFIPMDSSAAVGVRAPGCSVADDFDTELGDVSEALLATALAYRDTGVCPSPALSLVPSGITTSAVEPLAKAVVMDPEDNVMRNNRDTAMPN